MNLLLSIFILLSISFFPTSQAGRAVLTGGKVKPTNAAIYNTFINFIASTNEEQYIGVFTTGNSLTSAASTAAIIVRRLQRTYGAKKVEWIPFHKDNGTTCTSSTLLAKVKKLTGAYFNGGDAQLYLDCFYKSGKPTPALVAMQERYHNNKLALMGSSAGTLIVQSTPIPKSRESYNSLVFGSSKTSTGGFQFIEYGFVDVHFSQRARQGRLIRLIEDLEQYSHIGFGIDEDTAMVIDGPKFKVVGTNGVYVINADLAKKGTGKRFSVTDIRASYLTNGDSYTFSSKVITIPSFKKKITSSMQDNSPATMTSDIFSPGMFTTITQGLFRSRVSSFTYGYTNEMNPRYEVDFRKTSSSTGYIGKSGDIEYLSYINLYVDIYCVENC